MSVNAQPGPVPMVLVVDDNPVNRDLLARRLERAGYGVALKENALTIEADVETIRPDVVLLDWMMPGRSGLEALRALRHLRDSNRLPVIMVTALDDSQSITAAIAAGANDYVTKPIDFAVLRSRLDGMLARRADVLQHDAIEAELERLVELRTRDLLAANQKLEAEVTERRAAEVRASHLARSDALTGLANRLSFMERLRGLVEDWKAGGAQFYLIQVNIDRFRSINSVHGAETGDAVLQEIARRLIDLSCGCEIVARTNADEFAVLSRVMPNCPDLGEVPHTMFEALSRPVRVGSRKIAIGVSLAVTESSESDSTIMLVESEAAMRLAKSEGGGRVRLFDEAMGASVRDRVSVINDLRVGIPRGEIVPHFQPSVNLASGCVDGAEVLARWHHPRRGLVRPDVFIPAAEETGLVDDLFWAILPKACAEALRVGEGLRIAVNLSPSQILDQWFPQRVLQALVQAGLPPSQLEIEMTETALFADFSATRIALESLRNQGVSVALDDFGVGFSSLSLLRELPINKVKIDRSFVCEMLHKDEAASMVQGVIELCKKLGLSVTAEGIEAEEEALQLAQWGCDHGQGYWLGRPAAEIVVETPWDDLRKRAAA